MGMMGAFERWAELDAALARIDQSKTGASDADIDALLDAQDAIECDMLVTPASGVGEVAAKLRLALAFAAANARRGGTELDGSWELVESALRDLEPGGSSRVSRRRVFCLDGQADRAAAGGKFGPTRPCKSSGAELAEAVRRTRAARRGPKVPATGR